MDKNSFFWKMADGRIPPPPCAKTLGLEFVEIDGERGTIETRFEAVEILLNPVGNVQGGFLAAMLDDTMGTALSATLDLGQFAPTVNLNVQFHRPAGLGPLTGLGRVVMRGREMCHGSAELWQNDKDRRDRHRYIRHSQDVGETVMAGEVPELSAQERAGKAFPVSWDQFHRDCRALTWRLNEVGPFHAVIAITRGGLVPAAIVARELGVRIIDTVCIASYDHTKQGDLKILKSISADTAKLGGGTGKGLLIVDDLVDTGKTGRLVRDMLPDAHFATVYAKPMGRPLVNTFITEVSQDTWIFFPWDTALSFQPPIRDGAA